MATVPIEPNDVPAVAPQPSYSPLDNRFRVPVEAFGAPAAQAMSDGGAALMSAANAAFDMQMRKAQQDDTAAVTQAHADLENANTTTLYGDGTPNNPGFASLSGQNAIDAAPKVAQQIQANRQAVIDSLTNVSPAAKAQFAAVSAGTVAGQLGQLGAHVNAQRTAVANDASTARIASATNTAASNWNDPNALATTMQTIAGESNATAARMGLPPEARDQLVLQQQGDAAKAIITSALAGDPTGNSAAGILKRITGLPASVQAWAEQKIASAQSGAQAEARGALVSQISDNLASITRTGAPVTPLSPDHVLAVLGADDGQVALDRMREAGATYNAVQSVALTSPAEDAAKLAAMQPAGSDFAYKAGQADVLQRAIIQKQQALGRDPAGYVASVDPGAASLLTAATSDPSQFPAYAAHIDQQYSKLGMPTFNRPLLPASAAQNFVSNILSKPPADQASTVTGMLASIPDAGVRGRVMGDLVAAKLPSSFETMAAMPNSADQTLMASSIGNAKALRDALPQGHAQAIDNALSTDPTLANLRASMSFAPGGAAKFGDIVKTLQPMAYSLDASGAANPAARAAAAITSKYDFFDNGGQVARVPAGSLGAVEDHASTIVSGLTPAQLAVPANPSGISLSPDQLRGIALQSAQRGFWVTNESDSGLVRYGNNGLPVKMSNGQRLEFPFSAVNAAPSSVPQGFIDPATGGFNVGAPNAR